MQSPITGRRGAPLLALLSATSAFGAELETVVVTGSRAPQPATELAASIRAVGSEELRLVRAVHISEALARVPGTWISRGNGQEHLTAIRSPVFTGPGSCGAFYLAEDGLRLRPAGVCNVNELSEVNSEQAARIEVLRGPGNAVHGGNAQHGVINVISAPPPGARDASLALTGGPNGYVRALGSYGDRTDSGAWRLSLNTTHDGGYKDDSGYDLQKLSYRHDAEWSDVTLQSLLSLGNLEQETAGFVIGRGRLPGLRPAEGEPEPRGLPRQPGRALVRAILAGRRSRRAQRDAVLPLPGDALPATLPARSAARGERLQERRLAERMARRAG